MGAMAFIGFLFTSMVRTKSRNTLSNHARTKQFYSWHLSSLGDWSGIAKCWSIIKSLTGERRLCDTVYENCSNWLMFLTNSHWTRAGCRVFSSWPKLLFFDSIRRFSLQWFFASSSCSLRCGINSRLESISSFLRGNFFSALFLLIVQRNVLVNQNFVFLFEALFGGAPKCQKRTVESAVNIRVGTTIIINMHVVLNALRCGIGLFNDGVSKAVTLLKGWRFCNHVLSIVCIQHFPELVSFCFCFNQSKHGVGNLSTCQPGHVTQNFHVEPLLSEFAIQHGENRHIGCEQSQMDWPIVDWAPAHSSEYQCQVDTVCEWCRACWLLFSRTSLNLIFSSITALLR